ncbi:MAG: hypothetical protein GXP03_10155 [Alphaproteobacteria bacterium]|nr:hypothetical protein [Alphaproteobacteria bacterium]
MHLNEIEFEGLLPIDSYGPGFFRLGGVVHHGALILLPGQVQSWGDPTDFTVFLRADRQFDVVFLGTGVDMIPLSQAHRQEFDKAGLGLEIMSTPTACRTYNMLLAEGRRVAAGLIPV